jgi:hypothetical protein
MPDGNRFYSSPFILFDGSVFGDAWADSTLAGDQWSKCWLNTKQEVFATSGGLAAIIIGSNEQHNLLINVDEAGLTVPSGSGQQAWLTGVHGLPPVEFQMDFLTKSIGIMVEITVNFTYQLEGQHARVSFTSDRTPHALLLQTFEWNLQPV